MILKSLSKKKEISITFGYNTKTKEHYGLMMYHKNRLIKAYERVACQRKVKITRLIKVLSLSIIIYTHEKENKLKYANGHKYSLL